MAASSCTGCVLYKMRDRGLTEPMVHYAMKITMYPLCKWMNEVRNGDKKGNGQTKEGTRLGSDVGEKQWWRTPKIHNDNDYIQYEITRNTVPEIETVFIKACCPFIHHTREKWHSMHNGNEREKKQMKGDWVTIKRKAKMNNINIHTNLSYP